MAQGDGSEKNAWNLGLYPGVGMGLGVAVGVWLDREFGWGSKGLIAGAVIGGISGMYLLIKEAMRIGKD